MRTRTTGVSSVSAQDGACACACACDFGPIRIAAFAFFCLHPTLTWCPAVVLYACYTNTAPTPTIPVLAGHSISKQSLT